MAQNAHVPKFGNWEDNDNVPYTQYFENARKGKGGKLINPNDPQENPSAFSSDVENQHAVKSKHERKASREDGDAISRRSTSHSPHHQYGDRTGDVQRKATRVSGSDRSAEPSPLHPHYHVKAANKFGVSSPSWERKGSSDSSHGHAPHTPGRSRMKPSRGDETPERGSTVPKFGEWDERDPSTADGFTHIFNKVREEKQTGSAKGPMITDDAVYVNRYNQERHSKSTGCWCFHFGKK